MFFAVNHEPPYQVRGINFRTIMHLKGLYTIMVCCFCYLYLMLGIKILDNDKNAVHFLLTLIAQQRIPAVGRIKAMHMSANGIGL